MHSSEGTINIPKLIVIAGLVISASLTYSCSEIFPVFDYRTKFVGLYHVKGTISCYGPCSECFREWDTVLFVDYGSTDSTLYVLGEDMTFNHTKDHHTYGLHLWQDSLFFEQTIGGIGCGTNEWYSGIKVFRYE